MCFVVNKFLHLFQVLRNFQNTATAINAPPSPLHTNRTYIESSYIIKCTEDGKLNFDPAMINLALA